MTSIYPSVEKLVQAHLVPRDGAPRRYSKEGALEVALGPTILSRIANGEMYGRNPGNAARERAAYNTALPLIDAIASARCASRRTCCVRSGRMPSSFVFERTHAGQRIVEQLFQSFDLLSDCCLRGRLALFEDISTQLMKRLRVP